MPPARTLASGSTRALAIVAIALTLLGALPAPSSGAPEGLEQAREELRETRSQIRQQSRRLRSIQQGLNRLATEISRNEAQVAEAEDRIGILRGSIAVLEDRATRLEGRLGQRSRDAFILGPGAPMLYLLTATSAGDAASRVSLLSEMNRRDGLLAAKVQRNDERLARGQAEYARLQRAREIALQQLEVDRAELNERLAASRAMFAQLRRHKEEVLRVISRYRPFAVCPVQGPVAIADDFGIWVQRSKARGGDHVHQGNDMMAATGTPIVAPFDGVAVATPNKLGGNAVKVTGEYGYVYNAHLSRYGTLGPVEAGDVIGYVGATGNTSAPHDHFEWHPGGGAAVDPHEFLLAVC